MSIERRHRYSINLDPPSDSEFGDEDVKYSFNGQGISLTASPLSKDTLGVYGRNCMAIRTSSTMDVPSNNSERPETNESEDAIMGKRPSLTDLFNSIGNPEAFLQQGSAYLLQFLSCSQRMAWFFAVVIAIFYFYPFVCILLIASLTLILVGGHKGDDAYVKTRTAKWTITGYSYQMKDGFLTSPPFLDKCGQWRMVIKQKRGMDGLQTSLGLLCTDIFPKIEQVSATVTFFCTNQMGQEMATGGARNLKFQYDYLCPGDCAFTRHFRLPKKLMGQSETITIHCTVEFRKKIETFFRKLATCVRSAAGNGDVDGLIKSSQRKGKNVVPENGVILPGNLEFHDEDLPSHFRPVMRFVHHAETKTFVWEIPEFCSLLENSELWGVYSPQFFINSHDICAIWRMKLLEVQGVFRLHVQLRGLPRSVRQVKLWYILHLVDMYGDSVLPEHAACRVKYPEHMNLWDTTRHILYRRETILERFVGGDNNGTFTIRISIQMEPNDVSLMEVDSDEWIQCPRRGSGGEARPEGMEHSIPHGILAEDSVFRERKMLGGS